jgi:peroxiredoxin
MKNRGRRFVGFFIIFVFLLSLPNSYALALASSKEGKAQDSVAADFKLDSISGKTVHLKELRGKNLVLLFFATWCPYCQKKIKSMTKNQEAYKKDGVEIVLIDVGESARQVGSFASKDKISFDILLDIDSNTAMDYDVRGVPTFVLVSKEGKVLFFDNEMPSNYKSIFK